MAALRKEIDALERQAQDVGKPPLRIRMAFDPTPRSPAPIGERGGPITDWDSPANVAHRAAARLGDVEVELAFDPSPSLVEAPVPVPVPVAAELKERPRPPARGGFVWRSEKSRAAASIAEGVFEREF